MKTQTKFILNSVDLKKGLLSQFYLRPEASNKTIVTRTLWGAKLVVQRECLKLILRSWAQHPSQAQEDFFEKSFREAMVFPFAPLPPWERNGVFSLHCMPSERVFKRTTLRAWPLLLEARMGWPDLQKVKRPGYDLNDACQGKQKEMVEFAANCDFYQ